MLKSRFTKIRTNRTFSTSNHDPSSPNPVKKRSRSISEILDSDHTSSSPGHSPYLLTYHGYMCVDDPRSNKEVLSGLRAVRGGMFNNKLVSVTHHSGTLRVAEGTGEGILVCPLHSIGLVSREGCGDGKAGGRAEGRDWVGRVDREGGIGWGGWIGREGLVGRERREGLGGEDGMGGEEVGVEQEGWTWWGMGQESVGEMVGERGRRGGGVGKEGE